MVVASCILHTVSTTQELRAVGKPGDHTSGGSVESLLSDKSQMANERQERIYLEWFLGESGVDALTSAWGGAFRAPPFSRGVTGVTESVLRLYFDQLVHEGRGAAKQSLRLEAIHGVNAQSVVRSIWIVSEESAILFDLYTL